MTDTSTRPADVLAEDRGTLIGLTPLSSAGREWFHANVDIEATWRTGGTIWANAGPVRRVLDAAQRDGLVIAEPFEERSDVEKC